METKAEEDEMWLYDHAEKIGMTPTEEEVDMFVEKVAFRIAYGMNDHLARLETLNDIRDKRKSGRV